jgi:hypothetical protein
MTYQYQAFGVHNIYLFVEQCKEVFESGCYYEYIGFNASLSFLASGLDRNLVRAADRAADRLVLRKYQM